MLKKVNFTQIVILMCIIVFLLLIIVPLWSAFAVSFMTSAGSIDPATVLWPETWSIEGYTSLFQNIELLKPLINTIVYIFIGTLSHMLIISMAAYALVQKQLPGGKYIAIFFMFTMMIPNEAIMIPRYLMFQEAGMLNSIMTLVLITLASGFSIILMENYFKSIPDSFAESARIDGASEFKIFYSIYVPLAKNGFLVVMLFDIVHRWNEYGNALIYINDPDKYLIQQSIKQILLPGTSGISTFTVYPNMEMASVVVATVPILILYIVFQKQFQNGINAGGVKE